MKNNDFIDESKIYKALQKTKYFKKLNNTQINSGRFPDLPRFTKIQNYLLDSLFSIPDMHNPSAFRIYLYLIRQITGYNSRYSIEYHPKRIKAQMNIKNCFYNAVKLLEEKNMIYYSDKDGVKYIGLNAYPDTWRTEGKDRINEIIDKEVKELLGISDDDLASISSSSWSSSSSSSNSYPSDYDDDLMKMLETM
jgi:hypothetical protein